MDVAILKEYLTSFLPFFPYTLMILMFAFIMYLAHRSSKSNFNVYDYLMDPITGKASITRTLQLTAGFTATWTIIKEAGTNNLTAEMFGIYLGALGLSEGWSKYIGMKYGKEDKGNQNDTAIQS